LAADDGEGGDYSSIASLRLRARQHAATTAVLGGDAGPGPAGGGGGGGYPGSPGAQTAAPGGGGGASSCQFTLTDASCGGVAVL